MAFSLYTPASNTTPGNQIDQSVKTLMGLGQISDPVQGFQQATQAQNQAIAGLPQYANQQAAGLYQQSNLNDLINQHGLDLNTFVQMLQNDPMGQRYLNPTIAASGPTQETIGGQVIPGVVSALPQQTLENVNTPFAGASNPMAAMGMGNLQAGADVSSLGSLAQAIGSNLSNMENQLTQNIGGYNTTIQQISNLADRYMQQAQYNLSLQQAGLGASPLSMIADLEKTSGKTLDRATARKIYQSAWDSALTIPQQDQIAKAFKNRYGVNLEPQPLPAAEADKVNSTYTTLDTIDNILNYLQTHKNAPQGIGGNVQSQLIHLGLGVGLDPQTRQYLADLTSISGGGERQLIGGRLTGYLLQRLGIAFPTPANTPAQNVSILTKLRRELVNDLKTYADNQGYDSYLQLPGAESLGVVSGVSQ